LKSPELFDKVRVNPSTPLPTFAKVAVMVAVPALYWYVALLVGTSTP
jgi:hypothetical protein